MSVPISDLARLRNLCIEYGLATSAVKQGGLHDTLDILDRRAGIGTRGGNRKPCAWLGILPINQVGKRISLHEGRFLAEFWKPAPVERQYKNHLFHLGADGSCFSAEG